MRQCDDYELPQLQDSSFGLSRSFRIVLRRMRKQTIRWLEHRISDKKYGRCSSLDVRHNRGLFGFLLPPVLNHIFRNSAGLYIENH